jgi:hypothetical protein
MTLSSRAGRTSLTRRWKTALVAVAVISVAFGLTGCSALGKAVSAVKIAHNLLHGSAAINSLSSKIRAGDTQAYEVTYVTTGSSPATIKYAAAPPHDSAFDATTSGGKLEVITDPAGELACTLSSSSGSASGTSWSCLKLSGKEVDTYHLMYALYSGAYWIDFLKIYSVAAALHGVSISSSTMTVNGFNLQCAVVVSGNKPNQNTSKVCVTARGILGYVSVSSKSADFEIKSYSSSPPSSLFQVPSGATITTIPTTIPTTTS